ncbi:MAG TPA: hypothetical protein VJJ80_01835 [Patescibacteria group bacterium]|nr:hypothetical protein [Patescibacteria group bacterium]
MVDKQQVKKWKKIEVFLEFLVFGIIVGIAEDLITISVATDATISWRVVAIVVLIAIPFAFLGEILVDRIDFVEIFLNSYKKKSKNL